MWFFLQLFIIVCSLGHSFATEANVVLTDGTIVVGEIGSAQTDSTITVYTDSLVLTISRSQIDRVYDNENNTLRDFSIAPNNRPSNSRIKRFTSNGGIQVGLGSAILTAAILFANNSKTGIDTEELRKARGRDAFICSLTPRDPCNRWTYSDEYMIEEKRWNNLQVVGMSIGIGCAAGLIFNATAPPKPDLRIGNPYVAINDKLIFGTTFKFGSLSSLLSKFHRRVR